MLKGKERSHPRNCNKRDPLVQFIFDPRRPLGPPTLTLSLLLPLLYLQFSLGSYREQASASSSSSTRKSLRLSTANGKYSVCTCAPEHVLRSLLRVLTTVSCLCQHVLAINHLCTIDTIYIYIYTYMYLHRDSRSAVSNLLLVATFLHFELSLALACSSTISFAGSVCRS